MKSWFVLILAILCFVGLAIAALLDLMEEAERARALAAEQALYTECRSALDRRDRWQISVSCAVEIKTLLAEHDAMEVRAVAAETQLGAQREDQQDAIARAEARIIELEEIARDAADIINNAPRDDGGLVYLDAGRLRQLREGRDPG